MKHSEIAILTALEKGGHAMVSGFNVRKSRGFINNL